MVGALPFDVREIQPDALVCAGYKWLLGPYSIGVAYFGPRYDGGEPIEENWIARRGSEDFQRLVDYQDARADLNLRSRAYLHANCAHCHRKWGGGNADFDLQASIPLGATKAVNTPPGQGTFRLADPRILVPGDGGRTCSDPSALSQHVRDKGQLRSSSFVVGFPVVSDDDSS